MYNLEIRLAQATDLDSIYEIESSVIDSWPYELVKQDLFDNEFTRYFVGTLDGKIVGFITIMNIIGEVHINNIAVKEDFRKQGIGEKLLDYALNYYPKDQIMGITLEVREDNKPAIALYEKKGFVSVGIRKAYYRNNKNAYVMWKMIER